MNKEMGNVFQSTVVTKLLEGGLTPHQYDRIKNFLTFDRLPSIEDKPDVIVHLTTSPTTDQQSFAKRVDATLEASLRYPDAQIFVSGKRPDVSRATSEELDPAYSEAYVNAQAIIQKGVSPSRFELEEESTNTRDNVRSVLDMVLKSGKTRALFVCSSYMTRRVDFYIRKAIKEKGVTGFQYFILDADVREDKTNPVLSPEAQARKHAKILYEWTRLPQYRRKGDL